MSFRRRRSLKSEILLRFITVWCVVSIYERLSSISYFLLKRHTSPTISSISSIGDSHAWTVLALCMGASSEIHRTSRVDWGGLWSGYCTYILYMRWHYNLNAWLTMSTVDGWSLVPRTVSVGALIEGNKTFGTFHHINIGTDARKIT